MENVYINIKMGIVLVPWNGFIMLLWLYYFGKIGFKWINFKSLKMILSTGNYKKKSFQTVCWYILFSEFNSQEYKRQNIEFYFEGWNWSHVLIIDGWCLYVEIKLIIITSLHNFILRKLYNPHFFTKSFYFSMFCSKRNMIETLSLENGVLNYNNDNYKQDLHLSMKMAWSSKWLDYEWVLFKTIIIYFIFINNTFRSL